MVVVVIVLCGLIVVVDKKYGLGVSDIEIKIGNILLYSGFVFVFSIVVKVDVVYFKKINEEGGINGCKIMFIFYDDSYLLLKIVE